MNLSSKRSLYERFEERAKILRFPHPIEEIIHPLIRFIAIILHEIGITFPLVYLIPDIRRTVFTHQWVGQIAPTESKSFSFCARKRGILIIDHAEIEPLDGFSYEALKVTYKFNNVQNVVPTKIRGPGITKFKKVLLEDEDCLEITLTNKDSYGSVFVSLTVQGWEL